MITNVPNVWNDMGSVAYSADRNLFAAGCEDGSVRFWEAHSGKVARK